MGRWAVELTVVFAMCLQASHSHCYKRWYYQPAGMNLQVNRKHCYKRWYYLLAVLCPRVGHLRRYKKWFGHLQMQGASTTLRLCISYLPLN